MDYRNLSDSQVEAIMPGGVVVENIGSDWERYVHETSYKYTGSTVQLMRTVSLVKRRLSQDDGMLLGSWNLESLEEDPDDEESTRVAKEDGEECAEGKKKERKEGFKTKGKTSSLKLPPIVTPRKKHRRNKNKKEAKTVVVQLETGEDTEGSHPPISKVKLGGKSRHRRRLLMRRRSSKSLSVGDNEEGFNFSVNAAPASPELGRREERDQGLSLPLLHLRKHPLAKRGSIENIHKRSLPLRLSRRRSVNLKDDQLKTISSLHPEIHPTKEAVFYPSIVSELGLGRRRKARGWVVLRRLWINGTLAAYVKDIKAKERFRHAIRVVLILLKWISSLSEREADVQNDRRTFTDIASDAFASDELKNSGLTFDVSLYKAKKEINISNEAKHVLSIPSNQRTPEQLQTALYSLQHLKSFAEYPLHMQEKLCKVAWFQNVPPKRIIIRQGHVAENFYFILSGQALVRILEKNPKTGETNLRTATIMKKGTSFGELALLHHSTRTATVVSQDNVQLLAIGRDDFFDIFMSGQGPGEIPQHIAFISTLDFMKDWPIEMLLEHPECCLFHFFKRGVVIVKDSTQSDWMYIVKSGSCRVMKELKGVTPRLDRSRLNSPVGSRLPCINLDRTIESKVRTGQQPLSTHNVRVPSSVNRAISDYSNFMKTQQEPVMEPKQVTVDKEEQIPLLPRPGFSKSRYILFPKTQDAHFLPTTPRKPRKFKPKRSTPVSSLSDSPRDSYFDESSLQLKGPVFVQVQVLKPKDVFGLTTVHFEDDANRTTTSVSLVSNGAECVMLSKKFFMEHANELVKRMLRHQLRHYPTEDTLQENLQTKADWDLYKKRVLKDVIHSRKQVWPWA